ncbi:MULTISPECIES: ATP-binding protein [unclassified Coleofasciculus]|uniref:ATP-binding protein n=1 Tax=unclassified Coleofasciculus TaxID=2692782 RepID=UPI00188257D6|nr:MULTISPECIES: ATP-binding protein [unclassified Coleofasciculus]MBE9125251.1 response regulator [Coleofasciculus sp. LEGE 07081]MBE9148396.1 response regulator [Coleofasciculus sp. LEGE 07092]
MLTPSLKDCAVQVPVCSQTTGFAAVLEIFHSSGCDAIVVVSEQQYPLGVVNLRQITPHLMSQVKLEKNPSPMATGSLSQPLCELDPPVIEPLAIVPASLKARQFWTYLQQSYESWTPNATEQEHQQSVPCPRSQWALVEGDGKFLGLLNSWLLLKYLAPSQGEAVASEQPSGNTLNLLTSVLEQLPLPLSLQTATGQVLAENLTWRQQIGTSPNLDWVRVPTGLDNPSTEPQTSLASLNTSGMPYQKALDSNRSESAVAMSNQTQISLGSRVNPLPRQVGNRIVPKSSVQAAVRCYCATVPTPKFAIVAGRQENRSVPAAITAQNALESREISKTRQTINDRFFSFTKIPLLPPLLKEREWGMRRQGNTAHKVTKGQTGNSRLPESPNSNLWLVLAQDTTEQQQVAKELAAKNADLVQLNRLKDEFLACISHELKTPLTAVLGLSSLLKDQTLGELNERQARYARLIYQSGRQLMAVVNDILDLTRIETNQLELTLEPVQIQSVCDRAYAQARQVYLEKDQQNEESIPENPFTLELEPNLETIVADELRLRQMLVHLLSNALKFTETEGEIGLRVSALGGWIAFTVWDKGIGIPGEKQHLIFQKFQQLEEPLTRCFEGTGLGLVITQRLARLHGGDVSFVSKSGEGSEFTLLLPPCPPQGRGLTETDGWEHKGEHYQYPIRNRLVLIVETVLRYLEDLTAQLKRLGYWVVIARSGTEAVEKARSLQPCAILLNPLIPQLSGWDVLTLLKSDVQTRHIPVLVTATQAEKEQAYAHNADGFLSLPVQEPALLGSLKHFGKPQSTTTSALTVLYLSAGLVETDPEESRLIFQLTQVLSLQHSELNYRILEADDLDQAELLARVWHPDVILLDGVSVPDPLAYLKTFSLHPDLTSLPLVTLDRQITQAANQIIGLSVYPCLAPDNQQKIAALLEVIQIAAGLSRRSSILVMDIDNGKDTAEMTSFPNSNSLTPHNPWLRALMQYLQAAGYRSLLSSSWADVSRQLQDQTVDLLLVRLKESHDSSTLMQGLMDLSQFPKQPPILVLDHRFENPTSDDTILDLGQASSTRLESQLRTVATKILRGYSHSMSQLLDQIHQTLAQ